MRTSRCTPDSVLAQPCALWPLTSSVPDLRPASSPAVSSITSTLNLCRSAQRAYMRNSMRAQSQLSVPPAPGVNLDIGVVAVDLAGQQRLDLRGARLRRWSGFSCVDAFLFGRGVVLFGLGQVRRASRRRRVRCRSCAMEPSRSSSSVRSRMIFCAASALFQRLGSSTLAFSSARRRCAVSTSKMPPQQSHGLLDGLNQRFGFGAHYFSAFGMGDGASRGWRNIGSRVGDVNGTGRCVSRAG